jgi:transcription elongation GreA/GreB family factor
MTFETQPKKTAIKSSSTLSNEKPIFVIIFYMTLKQKVYNHYLQVINDKIGLLVQVLADLKESGINETKSTAGDKHETALAMLQIEQANIRGQLNEALAQKASLEKINPALVTVVVVNGSLIKTNKDFLFMSIALGKALVEGINVTALSSQSPLGTKLIGLRAGDSAEMHNKKYFIESIE